MGNVFLFPLKMLGWASAGFALAVGWKLGACLVDMVMQCDELLEKPTDQRGDSEEPLWKRKFVKVSEN